MNKAAAIVSGINHKRLNTSSHFPQAVVPYLLQLHFIIFSEMVVAPVVD